MIVEISLHDIFENFKRKKIIFFSIIIIIFISVFSFSKLVADKYTSTTLLAYQNNLDSSQMSSLGQFSGLASMAGIDLGAESSNRKQEVLAILTSKEFLSSFIDDYNLLPYIIAGNGWNMEENEIKYNRKIYSEKNNWVRAKKKYRDVVPTVFEGQEDFLKNNLRVSENRKNGLISISLVSHSPYLSREILINLTDYINDVIKSQDLEQSKKSIKFIDEQIEKVEIIELKDLFYRLKEEQLKKIMLAETKQQYILKTVDVAYLPEKPTYPNRALFYLLGLVLGALMASLYIIFLTAKNAKN